MLALAACAAVAGLASCARDGGEATPGPLRYAGSSTISETVLPELIAGYEQATGHKFGAVSKEGSVAGFRAMMEGKASVAGMSRALRSAEKAQSPFYEIIGYDAVAVFVHPDNPVGALSSGQLKDIFTGKLTNWKQVGGPDLPIEAVREHDDGRRATVQMFREVALESAALGPATELDLPSECVRYVGRGRGAITYASLSFAGKDVKIVTLDGIAPTMQTVRSGEYGLSRPLLLVSKTVPSGELKVFFSVALSPQGQAAVGKYFVPRREPER